MIRDKNFVHDYNLLKFYNNFLRICLKQSLDIASTISILNDEQQMYVQPLEMSLPIPSPDILKIGLTKNCVS